MKNKKIFSVLLIIVFLFTGCSGSQTTVASNNLFSTVEVNGKKLNIEEFETRYGEIEKLWNEMGFDLNKKDMKKMQLIIEKSVVNQMISEEIYIEKAKAMNLKFSDKELSEYKSAFSIDSKDEKTFKRSIEFDLLSRKITQEVTKDVIISDEEAKEYYDKNPDKFNTGERIHIRHILLDNEEEAKKVLDMLKKGDNFEMLAKKYSKDLESGKNGGDLGITNKGILVSELEEVAFKLEKGQITEVVKSPFGYHIVKLEEKIGSEKIDFNGIKDKIKENLLLQKQTEVLKKFLSELEKNTKLVNPYNKEDKK